MRTFVRLFLSSAIIGAFLVGNVSFVSAATPVSLSLQSTEQTLSVSWTVPADATAQEIRYAASAMDESNFAAGIAASAPSPIPSASQSITISGLQPSTAYFVGYRYTDTVGDSAYSFASLGTLAAPQNLPPSPVTGLSVSASAASISLSWTAPADNDLSQYEVRYSTAPMTESSFTGGMEAGGAPLPIAGTAQSFSIGGLSQGTTYYAGVRVLDTVGNASPAVFISATTQTSGGGGGGGGGVSAPPPVTSFTASGGSVSARLAWHTPSASGLSEFDVRYATSTISETDFTAAARATGAPLPLTDQDQEFTVTGLVPSVTYFFAIKTVNTVGMSSPLVAASTTVGESIIPPVSNLSATPGMGTVDVRWHTPTSTVLSMFDVRIAPFPFDASSFASGTAASGAPLPLTDKDQGFTITGLSLATSYTIGVRIVSTTGDVSEIRFVSATTQAGGGGGGGGGGGANSIGGGANSITASATVSGSSVEPAPDSPVVPVRRIVPPRARPFATIITIRPYKLTVAKGDSVTVTLVAHPEDSRKYGADISLSYPPALLALESVEYGEGWTPSYEEGRNVDDAAQGMIERSIAFSSGFIEPLRVMTLTFIARENGEGSLHTTDGPTFVLRGDRTPLRMEALLSVVSPSAVAGQNLFASLFSVIGGNNIVAFASTFVFFFILYMAYLAVRDKKRDGFVSFIR